MFNNFSESESKIESIALALKSKESETRFVPVWVPVVFTGCMIVLNTISFLKNVFIQNAFYKLIYSNRFLTAKLTRKASHSDTIYKC